MLLAYKYQEILEILSYYLYNLQCPVNFQDAWAEVFAETKTLKPNLTVSFETSCLQGSSNVGLCLESHSPPSEDCFKLGIFDTEITLYFMKICYYLTENRCRNIFSLQDENSR